MVNTLINVSAYQGAPPDDLDTNKASRKILGGPIYDKDDILKVLEGGEGAIRPWTKNCISDLKKYEISHDEVENYIRIALASGKFKGSEWCKGKNDGVYAACDSYQILVKEWVPVAHKEMTFEYYVKFAIGKLGNLMLIISCHPPEDRR